MVKGLEPLTRVAAVSDFPQFYAPRFSGLLGNGSDQTVAFQAALDSLPTDSVLWIPRAFDIGLSAQINMLGRRNIAIMSETRVANFGGGAPPTFTWLGTGGKMFNMDSCQGCTIQGFLFRLASGKTIDKFIDIDGTGVSGTISTANHIKQCSLNASNQSNANFKAISISETSSTNNENNEISECEILASSGQGSAAIGIGIYNGPSPNAKHQKLFQNTFTNCGVGIQCDNGSFEATHIGGSWNNVGIKVLSYTEPIKIAFYETEADVRAADISLSAGGGAGILFEHCRFSNSNQTNSGGYLKCDGWVTLLNCRFESVPPAGGKLFERQVVSNVRLISIGTKYPNITMAQVGYDYFAGIIPNVTFTRDQLISIGDMGISDAPSIYSFQYGGVNPDDGNIANQFFGMPIQHRGFTTAQLTGGGIAPQAGTIVYCTDSTKRSPGSILAGGGSHKVIVYWDGSNWVIYAVPSASGDTNIERDVIIARDALITGVVKIGGNQVVGPRETGWTAGTGTANKGAFATYAGQDVSATYVEAEVQNIDNATKANSERIKALEDAARMHGLIN